MANDNNIINDLVSGGDEDPTSELESLLGTAQGSAAGTRNAGADEDTFDFDQFDRASEIAGKSVAALKSDIRSRNESISRLQFDIEQLRARWSGLEKEIKAREELTDKVNAQHSETQQKLQHTESLLNDRISEIDDLRLGLKEKRGLFTLLEKEARHVSDTVESGKSVIDGLQQKIADQRKTIRDLTESGTTLENTKNSTEKALSDKDATIHGLEKELSQSREDEQAQANELSLLEPKLQDALRENEKLGAALDAGRTPQEREDQRRLDDQDGLIAGNVQEIIELRQQVVRTERYADDIRARLRDLAVRSSDTSRKRHQLEASRMEAANQNRELKEQLDSETLQGSELRKQNEQLQRDFAKEIKLLRFELGGAEKTIADQETAQDQLASDLFDNQGYRQALELQLDKSNKKDSKNIADLNRKLNRLERANADIERKLENKDNAIAALLSELASRSKTIESIGEIENVIHEIDGRMSDQIDDNVATEKDRVTRLLIGNIGGQELQFPLFKDRLTIGRTANNDIQLKAHFISRRHAVIVTEGEQTRIIDWGSKNGVYVNDSRIAEQVLKNGDVVAIGTAEFRYEERSKR